MSDKEIVLVLHHTYLHDAFRNYSSSDAAHLEHLKKCWSILRFLIEKKTEDHSIDVASTSGKVWCDFNEKYDQEKEQGGNTINGSERLIEIIDKIVFRPNDTRIDSLSPDAGVITIADKILSLASVYDPVLVVNDAAKDGLQNAAVAFYKESLKEKFTSVPFRIMNYTEILDLLEATYPDICTLAKSRVPQGSMF